MVAGSAFSGIVSGSMGRSFMFHFCHWGLTSPGSHSDTRWPSAQVTT